MLRSNAVKRLAWTLALVSSASLTACTMMTGSRGQTDAAPFCKTAEPIYWSSKDTAKTIAQAKEHNAVGKSLCGWGQK